MYTTNILHMVSALTTAGMLAKEDRDRAADIIRRECWTDRIALAWGIDDVQGRDSSLTDEDARAVLELVLDKMDASLGVNWDIIEARIYDYKEGM